MEITFLLSLGLLAYAYKKLTKKTKKYINKNGYIVLPEHNELEHRYIAMQILKRDLAKNEVVHHIDGNKINNKVNNLCLMDREKHEFFHSWLLWKRQKSGRYPSFKDQYRVLEEEYGGVLLKGIKHPNKEILKVEAESEVELSDISLDNVDLYLVRRNRTTKKIFVEFEGEFLINPEGKEIELDTERFIEPEEVSASELTPKQIEVYQNKMNSRYEKNNEDRNKAMLQNLLYEELRQERKKIALETKKELYEIFNNNTLAEMAEVMPDSEMTMLQISGVGPIKYRMYGKRFLSTIERFKKEHKNQSSA